MYNAIISTITRDDDSYLDEWVGYHMALGFEHIVLYDHRSVVPVKARWGKRVEVIPVGDREDPHVPNILHNETLKRYKTKAHWMSLLDPDEFIVLYKHTNIQDFLAQFEAHGAVLINHIMYGTSGHIKRPPGRVIDNYTWRCPDDYWRNGIAKMILKPAFCTGIYSQHEGHITKTVVNEDFKIWNKRTPLISTRTVSRINHYYTRSFEEWLFKMNRANAYSWNTDPRSMALFTQVDDNSTVYDPVLKDFKF